jgi:hypothetical protein
MQASVNMSRIINTFHYVSTDYFNQNLCKEQAFLLVYIYIYIYCKIMHGAYSVKQYNAASY